MRVEEAEDVRCHMCGRRIADRAWKMGDWRACDPCISASWERTMASLRSKAKGKE